MPFKSLYRGKTVFRIEALSDAVFAISVTLLIMSLEVPKTYTELELIIKQFLPFLATVSMIFFIWWLQNNFFRNYGLDNVTVRFLNLCLLIIILFYVFPLKFLFTLIVSSIFKINYFESISNNSLVVITESDLPNLIMFFSVGYALVWLIFFLLYRHIWLNRTKLKLSHLEFIALLSDKRDALFQLTIGLTSTLFAILGWTIGSQITFLTIPVWLLVNYFMTSRAKNALRD
ncbi:DUF1211 domain-containing protein [Paucihalobacter ruber]|uniref:DUF1211 domain-containing protein n=1 Tax=Paucihalobacter ruber TaxID=2567861 RepID=A0A506PPB0_9FLAO|nr:TMEM175 family protein [Paucihalobacter ruber]TPV35398.1 DUF1211 domain-containing protein [Paucihalobacter ruber]